MTRHLDELDTVIVTAATVHAQAAGPVEAFAVCGGRVVATGALSDLRERFNRAEVRDFGAATVVPGFNDAHAHLGIAAENALHLDLSPAAVDSREGLLERVGAEAARGPKSGWVRGSRYDDRKTGRVARADLDAVTGSVPTVLLHMAAHQGVANSAALAAMGYHDDDSPPPGGEFGRDETGRLDGWLMERALMDLVYPAMALGETPVPISTREQQLVGLQRITEQWHAAGMTSVCDAFVGPDDIELFHIARQRGDLTLRTGFLLTADYYDRAEALGIGSGFGDDFLRMAGVKLVLDGACGGRACMVSEPFVGTDDHGQQLTDTARLHDVVRRAQRRGDRMGIHANGDTAIRMVLDIYEEVSREYPRPGLRHRIEHCTVVDEAIVGRIAALGTIVVPFAGYVGYYGSALDEWYGPERTAWMFAHRSFLDAGVTTAGSSDYPCAPPDPLFGIQSMVTRRGADDGALVGARQRISPAEALEVYTVGSATASGDEHHKGRLMPGFLADFVVLDADPLAVDPDGIAGIGIRETYVGGSRVWAAS